MRVRPSDIVLRGFGCTEPVTPLAGGQGVTWRSGEIVLKPMFDPAGAMWEAETLANLPQRGYRISRPLGTTSGEWTCEGWTASAFVEGVSPKGTHLGERFGAARSLHADLAVALRPAHFDTASDPWDLADRIAFGFADWKPDPRIAACLTGFRRLQAGVDRGWQVIHGDLAGNFLIQAGHLPAIIDFTPKWSPRGFGEAVMAVDICLWEGIRWGDVARFLLTSELDLTPLAAARRLLEIDTRHRMLELDDGVFEQVRFYENLLAQFET